MKKWSLQSWVANFQLDKKAAKKSPAGFVYFLGQGQLKKFSALVKQHALSWQSEALRKNEKDLVYFSGKSGPVWIVRAKAAGREVSNLHSGLLDESSYAWSRDLFGGLASHFRAHQLKLVQIEFMGTDPVQELGALTGFEIASYQFRAVVDEKQLADLPAVSLRKVDGGIDEEIVQAAVRRAKAVNTARHLVNLPPNELNPSTFANLASKGLGLPKSMQVQVWNTEKLEQEKMGLHLSVGRGAEHGPCMVHMRYRPKTKSVRKPVAFVGKGITFDTGGLDIKPSSGMRLMKKDMGGAASVIALAQWVAESNYPHPCDFYLALAENAIDANSFRPSDIFVARNGLKVEIDNTDAEGRLVLADCLDVAVTQKNADEPELVIDVATLTGAIKVGLGAEIAGLFANDDELGNALTRAGQQAGDLNWRMPLFEKYWGGLSSPFADFKNSGEGFGGAITAALFLQRFVRGKKWAHLDVYAWTDRAQGAFGSAGGSGQPVQCLIEFLEGRV